MSEGGQEGGGGEVWGPVKGNVIKMSASVGNKINQ